MRTIPWVTLLCEMGTARPLRRWTATKHGRYNERFYHKEPVMPTKAGTCSMGTPGRVEHRARNASGHREDMSHCRPDDVRGGFVLCRCVERADLARRLDRRHGQDVGGKSDISCRPRLFSTFALCSGGTSERVPFIRQLRTGPGAPCLGPRAGAGHHPNHETTRCALLRLKNHTRDYDKSSPPRPLRPQVLDPSIPR